MWVLGGQGGLVVFFSVPGFVKLSPPTHNHLREASLNCPLCFQPLDLCNPARTLLLSEELLLYEGRNKAAEVRLAHTVPRLGFPVGFVGRPPGL